MAPIRIGILSDTHLSQASGLFKAQSSACFSDVSIIFHAGDLTSGEILKVFADQQVFAVHGNMCDASSRADLPALRNLEINNFNIVLTHGHGFGYHDIEDRLFTEFAEADCIVYGHTHKPVCHKVGDILFINPGSFAMTGRFGQPGTYAILEIGTELRGRIMQVPEVL